jgi:peptide/nickel transport system permease protein
MAAWASVTLAFVHPAAHARRSGDGDVLALPRARSNPRRLDALREAFGFSHAPLWKQYLQYLNHTLRGDLGISIATTQPRSAA